MRKIGIVGSRRRYTNTDFKFVKEQFFEVYREGSLIVSGGCPKGGDEFAHMIAKQNGIPILIFYPDWKKYGKTAGFIRNTHIAENSDILIACVAADRTGGTEDTIRKFLKTHENNCLFLV